MELKQQANTGAFEKVNHELTTLYELCAAVIQNIDVAEFLQTLIETDDRPRIRIKIAEIFADHDWAVKGYRPKVEQTLPEGFQVTAKGLIRRR